MPKMNIGDIVPIVCFDGLGDDEFTCPICNIACIQDYDEVYYCQYLHQYKHNGKDTVRIQDRTILNFRIYHTRWYNIFNRIRYWILSKEIANLEGDRWVSLNLPKEEEV